MPELPEVETVRRTLLPHVLGRQIVAVEVREPRLRSVVDALRLQELVVGRTIGAVRRRAKYLLFDLGGGLAAAGEPPPAVMLVHLGMSGCLGIAAAQRPLRRHDHLIWTLAGGRQLRLNDARRFGLVDAFAAPCEAAHPRLAHLGVEPLDAAAFTGAHLFARSRGLARPVKNFIMDAQHVVGVGNIYACEALYASRIHPRRPAGKLSLRRCSALAGAIRDTLRRAIEEGGTTLRDFSNVDGEAGYFAVRLQAYGREGLACGACQAPIRRLVQAGRSTFYCGRCQH